MIKLYTKKTSIAISFYKDKKCSILHREDGPAIEHFNGDKFWYFDSRLHRINGPAIEYNDGTKYWYVNGKECSEKEHKRLVKMINYL